MAFSPPELTPEEDRHRLERLCASLPSIMELSGIPPTVEKDSLATAPGLGGTFSVSAPGLPVAPCVLKPTASGWETAGHREGQTLLASHERQVVTGFPLAYVWLRGSDRPAMDRILEWALGRHS